MAALCEALQAMLNRLGDVPSPVFIADPQWPVVMTLAASALECLSKSSRSQGGRKARIIKLIPIERVDRTQGDGISELQIGDLVELDQGFTFPSGQAGGMVICANSDDSVRWVADILISEIEWIQ